MFCFHHRAKKKEKTFHQFFEPWCDLSATPPWSGALPAQCWVAAKAVGAWPIALFLSLITLSVRGVSLSVSAARGTRLSPESGDRERDWKERNMVNLEVLLKKSTHRLRLLDAVKLTVSWWWSFALYYLFKTFLTDGESSKNKLWVVEVLNIEERLLKTKTIR